MAAYGGANDGEYDRNKEIMEFDNSKMGVKGLLDSGLTTIPKFFIHPREKLPGSIKSSSSDSAGVPVIDISNANSTTHRPKIIQQIREAAKTWGFFQVTNHGIPISVLDSTILAIKGFHELPAEEKAKYYNREERQGVMYASNFDLHRSDAACWIDTLQVWMAPVAPAAEDIPEVCRREIVEWDVHAKKVGEGVLEMLCEGMGLESDRLKKLGCSNTRNIVGHYYPFCPQPDLTIGITSHTDPQILTVLLPNEVPGLQVKHGEEWVDVNPVHGGLIINIGDCLQIISNDECNSVQHRVLANGSREPRISIVDFFILDTKETKQFGPLPELVSPEKPPVYRNFIIDELHESFFSKGLDSKSFVEKLRL